MRRSTDRDLTRLALDPCAILQSQGLTPDPWQRELLGSRARRVLLNCSRGAGKSRVCSALALFTALRRPGATVLLLSRALRQACELLRYVKQGWLALGQPHGAVRRSETQLELGNGSRVLSLPGREETIRSFQGVGLLAIDEAARVPDELYWSVRPMLNVSRGRLVCLSTPFGARGFFWKEWHDLGAKWKRVRVPWQDCPRLTADMIADERRAMGTGWAAQEYECSFVAMEGLVYPELGEAVVADVPLPEGRRVGGIDFGWRNPFAAVWGVLDRDDVLWIGGERYLREVALHDHASALRALGPISWHADPAGRTEIEELRRAGLSVIAGVNDLRPGIGAVNARIRSGRLKVLRERCPQLLREAGLHRYPTAREQAETELPLDRDNHALAALRYLVSKLDAAFLARLRRPEAPTIMTPPIDNEEMWTRIR